MKLPLWTHRITRQFHSVNSRLIIFGITGVAIIVGGTAIGLRTSLPVTVSATQTTNHPVNGQLVVSLGQKLRTVDTSKIELSPAVEGRWTFKPGTLLGDDQLVFTPTSYFRVATTYRVTVPSSPRLIIGASDQKTLTITTERAPGLMMSGLARLTEKSIIAADHTFEAKLASPNRQLRDLVLKISPSRKLSLKETIRNDQLFRWQPRKLLPQGKKLTIELFDKKNAVSLAKKTVTIAKEPRITSPLSRSDITRGEKINIEFDQPIDPSSTKKIRFSVDGSGRWINDRTYQFTPKNLAPGKAYSYQVASGLRSKAGGIIGKTQTGRFLTIGAVSVVRSTPWGEGLQQAEQTLSFTFNQPVDHASARERLSVSSGTIISTSLRGNTLYARIKNLGYQQNVSATLAPGIKNTSFGLPSTTPFSLSFSTEVRSHKLPVPYFSQQYAASCTAAALRMALAFKGINSNDMSIVQRMGYNPRPMNKKTNPPTWDDPNEMFVGSINGSIRDGTGAGPDAPPVAKAARSFGRGAEIVYGAGPAWVASQIYANNPVIIFGAFANTEFTTWKTPSGRTVRMNLTSHVSTVIGVHGEPTNPIGFWVNDPLAGGTQYWTAGQLAADIARDVSGQAVVIR